MTRVGFIGLGSQGAPMARRIVEAGFPLTLWARRPETVEPFGDTPATLASTPAELGAVNDIVGICVVAGADVEDVLLRSDGVLSSVSASATRPRTLTTSRGPTPRRPTSPCFILAKSAHCHNTASTRHQLWDRLGRWIRALDASTVRA